MLDSDHAYSTEIIASDPLYDQPERITTNLKPHQLAGIYKGLLFERKGYVNYNIQSPAILNGRCRGSFRIRSNIGVLGDIVGYGKTLTALGIIAANPVDNIYREKTMITSCYSGSAHTIIEKPLRSSSPDECFIKSTLVVVPHGPVFMQWTEAIRQHTSLSVLIIDSQASFKKQLPYEGSPPEMIRQKLSEYDLVLVKNTMVRKMIQHFDIPYRSENPLTAWARIMVDEAHDMMNFIPPLEFHFMWMITSTYPVLAHKSGTRHVLTHTIRHIDQELLRYILVKGNPTFVQQSFSVPRATENYIECRMAARLQAIQPFLQGEALERINANDIAGAVRAIGGHNETEEDILQLLTRNLQRDISNKEHAIRYIQSIDIADDVRDQRLRPLQTDLTRLKNRLDALTARITQLDEKVCPICLDTIESPIILPCTHVMCGGCMFHWMRSGTNGSRPTVCPECRSAIDISRIVAVVQAGSQDNQRGAGSNPPPLLLDKEDMLIKIIKEKPNGRFLIFSRVDATFIKFSQRLLQEGITSCEMKGTTSVMMRNLERFERGEVRVILLNTFHAGSGINISSATDVVIFHSMGIEKTQAIGRAQRVGRREPLTIHNLCYPHEMPHAAGSTPAGPASAEARTRGQVEAGQGHIDAVDLVNA